MPKLPSLTPQKVKAILEKKGFVLKRITGSHYIFAHPETKRRVTVPYHSNQDIARATLKQILEDAGIKIEELQDLL
ncbi:type II toxin-antitoxin system HicA family toxin [Methanothrix sp.]|jgi:predicted RNA binding protein YcfA (HicA-like mRNA interferase family)|uniref:type II toxin-antitoxin system HicA family toxin n=1 Tax=Methanothrix sp. TaxID=90426 RepID=UPI003BB53B7B